MMAWIATTAYAWPCYPDLARARPRKIAIARPTAMAEVKTRPPTPAPQNVLTKNHLSGEL